MTVGSLPSSRFAGSVDSLTMRAARRFRSTASSYPPPQQLPPDRSDLELSPLGVQLAQVRERFRGRTDRRVATGLRVDPEQLVLVDRDQVAEREAERSRDRDKRQEPWVRPAQLQRPEVAVAQSGVEGHRVLRHPAVTLTQAPHRLAERDQLAPVAVRISK